MTMNLDHIETIKKIVQNENLSNAEKLDLANTLVSGDFWYACDLLIACGWAMTEFDDDDIREIFNESFDNPVGKNLAYLENRISEYKQTGKFPD